jgi:hypothetical protein
MQTLRQEIFRGRDGFSGYCPPVTRKEFLGYIHASLPAFEDDLRPISELQYYDNETGCTEPLFVDDTDHGVTAGKNQPSLKTLYTN